MTKKQKALKLKELREYKDGLLYDLDQTQNELENIENQIKKIEAIQTSDCSVKEKIARLQNNLNKKIRNLQSSCKHRWVGTGVYEDKDKVCEKCGLSTEKSGVVDGYDG